ncbi:DUF4185 domain-containing protein [Hyalangium gracile]|uniref:DUF4185 domain-containing protein n=1 Tax=Hyalangium gracile TaxID=394092 RepID=UPI001CC9392E|nr:DUF4185 domain-containing protein [Hyalangium gracile]
MHRSSRPSRLVPLLLAAGCMLGLPAGCGGDPASEISGSGASYPEADGLFHQDARWLGADGAYSIDLGAERTLWLFGDTFVAKTPANVRNQSEMVRNTVAVQTGRDPRTATMTSHWRMDAENTPASYFGEIGDTWHWPGHGVLLPNGHLVVFLSVLERKSGGLGFDHAGWRVAFITNPSGSPDTWDVQLETPARTPFDAVPGAAVVLNEGFVVAVAPRTSRDHDAYLVRWPVEAFENGELRGAQWWVGEQRGWVSEEALDDEPSVVIPEAGTECSVHWDARLERWIHVTSQGFGATKIAVRTAKRLEGPWTEAEALFTPPESKERDDPFVYAAKAHPQLTSDEEGALLVTYATNSFEFKDLFEPQGADLYWPRFVRLRLEPKAEP